MQFDQREVQPLLVQGSLVVHQRGSKAVQRNGEPRQHGFAASSQQNQFEQQFVWAHFGTRTIYLVIYANSRAVWRETCTAGIKHHKRQGIRTSCLPQSTNQRFFWLNWRVRTVLVLPKVGVGFWPLSCHSNPLFLVNFSASSAKTNWLSLAQRGNSCIQYTVQKQANPHVPCSSCGPSTASIPTGGTYLFATIFILALSIVQRSLEEAVI